MLPVRYEQNYDILLEESSNCPILVLILSLMLYGPILAAPLNNQPSSVLKGEFTFGQMVNCVQHYSWRVKSEVCSTRK